MADFNSHFDVGVDCDIAFERLISSQVTTTSNASTTSIFAAHQRSVGTVQVKVGRPFGRWLIYGSGGLAIAGLAQGVKSSRPAPAGELQVKSGGEGVEFGGATGGDFEYSVNRKLSYHVESAYYRLQDREFKVAADAGFKTGYSSILQNSGSLLRVAVNYHF